MDASAVMADARAKLERLPVRPSSEEVAAAHREISAIDKEFAERIEVLMANAKGSEVSEEESLFQGAKISSAKAEADSKKVKPLSIIALEEQHAHFESVIQKVQSAVVNGEKEELKSVSTQETARQLLLDIEKIATEGQVKEADFSFRYIQSLPEKFGAMLSLEQLNLSGNSLESIPDSIAGLVNLRILQVSNNKLTSLPDSIGALSNLQVLDASKNQLTRLPETLWSCGNLEELSFFFNKLNTLPQKFASFLLRLRKLNLGFNKLMELPEDIGKLSELTFLDAHFNRIKRVPTSIGELTKLEFLDLSDNFADLKALPSSLGNLFHVKVLRLRNNQIAELPVEIGRLSQLEELALEGNPWVEPPYELVKQGKHAVVMEYLQKRYTASQNPETNEFLFSNWGKWIQELLAGGNWQLANWLSQIMSGSSVARLPNSESDSGQHKTAEMKLLELKEVAVDLESGASANKV